MSEPEAPVQTGDWSFIAERRGDKVWLELTVHPDGAAEPTTVGVLLSTENAQRVSNLIVREAGDAFHRSMNKTSRE